MKEREEERREEAGESKWGRVETFGLEGVALFLACRGYEGVERPEASASDGRHLLGRADGWATWPPQQGRRSTERASVLHDGRFRRGHRIGAVRTANRTGACKPAPVTDWGRAIACGWKGECMRRGWG